MHVNFYENKKAEFKRLRF